MRFFVAFRGLHPSGRQHTNAEQIKGSSAIPASLDQFQPRVAPPQDLLRIARAEWGIENGLHHRRDVTLEEDACQLRRGQAPQTNAALNNLVVSMVLSSGETNLAPAQREFAYAIDRAFARAAFAAGRL